jgi:glycosyltransferase involved in cell wall biosynthesis
MRGHLKGCVDSADVVHLWGAGASGYLAAAAVDAANRTSTPIAITPFAHPGQWGEDPGYEWSYRHADRVIGLLAADLEVYENLGVPRSRLREIGVCSPGVSPISKNDARRTLGVSGPLVVFLGARRPYKGYDLLIEATHSLEEAIPDLRVAIVGPGAPLARSASNVLDVGEVSESERGMWLAAADVMCLPSAGEIFPVSILEAWSARTAVLTSNLPPLVELAKRSGGAVCTERSVEGIGTALRSLFSSPGRIEALAEAGFKYWRRGHTVDAVVDRHVDLYKELIASA